MALPEDRQKMFDEYVGDKTKVAWPWLQYTRYRKAEQILASLVSREEDISKLQVLDYGCGVGDYGMTFARAGADVTFLDHASYLNFVKYRLEQEPISAHLVFVGEPLLLDSVDLAIFGEVLEHLPDPLVTLQSFVAKGIRYLYTSSYPYRSDDPTEAYWQHHGEEQFHVIKMQQPCRALLEANYTFSRYEGEARLWLRKDA